MAPDGTDIFIFINIFVETNARSGNPPLHFDTIEHGIIHLVKALEFHYEAFEFNKHKRARLKALLTELVDEGKLTRKMRRSREPAGAVVVRRLVHALYKEAITKGTELWSATIQDIAAIVLISCLQCRAGDILDDTAVKDTRPELPGLRYSDVHLVIKNNGSIVGRWLIRNSKGDK
jgi:hypothetical protein